MARVTVTPMRSSLTSYPCRRDDRPLPPMRRGSVPPTMAFHDCERVRLHVRALGQLLWPAIALAMSHPLTRRVQQGESRRLSRSRSTDLRIHRAGRGSRAPPTELSHGTEKTASATPWPSTPSLRRRGEDRVCPIHHRGGRGAPGR